MLARFVVGLPVHLSGNESQKSREARAERQLAYGSGQAAVFRALARNWLRPCRMPLAFANNVEFSVRWAAVLRLAF